MNLTIVHLYPRELGINGDVGNVTALRRRAEWRGMPVRVVDVGPGDALPDTAHLVHIGSGPASSRAPLHDDVARHRADPADVGGGRRAVPGDRRRLAAARPRGHRTRSHGARGREGLPVGGDRQRRPDRRRGRGGVRARRGRGLRQLRRHDDPGSRRRVARHASAAREDGLVAGNLVGDQPARTVPADEPGVGRSPARARRPSSRGLEPGDPTTRASRFSTTTHAVPATRSARRL